MTQWSEQPDSRAVSQYARIYFDQFVDDDRAIQYFLEQNSMHADVVLYPTSSCAQVEKQVRTTRNIRGFRDLMVSVNPADPDASIDPDTLSCQ